MTFLIVGLGNPGPEYARNRHNIGFFVVDELARTLGPGAPQSGEFRSKWQSLVARGEVAGEPIILQKPQQYMNRSGGPVAQASRFYDIACERIVVVHDELDLEFGVLKIKRGGGVAGHNGLRSLVECLGTSDFLRIRMGIGKPVRGSGADYVLSDFNAAERTDLADFVQKAAQATTHLIQQGVAAAMNRYNTRPEKAP